MDANTSPRLERIFARIVARAGSSSRSTRCCSPPSVVLRAARRAGQLDRPADRRRAIPTTSPRARSRRSSARASTRCCWPRPTIPSRRRCSRASTRSSSALAKVPHVEPQLGALDLPARQGRLRRHARAGGRVPQLRRPAPTCSASRAWSATHFLAIGADPRRARHRASAAQALAGDRRGDRAATTRRRSPLRNSAVGQPYVNAYLDDDAARRRRATSRSSWSSSSC